MEFSTRSMHNLIVNQTSKRVSNNAANKLGEQLQEYAENIAKEATQLANEDGYQTVQQKHIREALLNNSKVVHHQEFEFENL
jgi:histone H3/H4